MTKNKHRHVKGFTLFETLLALSIGAMLISVVFMIMNTCLGLSDTLAQVQRGSRRAAAAERQLENIFSRLPSNAQLSIVENDDGILSLQIQEPGIYFPQNGKELKAALARFDVIEKDNKTRALVLTCESEPLSDNEEDVVEYPIELIITEGDLRWEIYSPQESEWLPEWTGARPTIIRLFHDEDGNDRTPAILTNFWIPPRPAVNNNEQNQRRRR